MTTLTPQQQTALNSIIMLEKHYNNVKNLRNDNKQAYTLPGTDLSDWKNTYYPQLVQSGFVRDGSFFQNPVSNPNYGIGADGGFTKYEYVQYLWSAYKYVPTDFSANSGVKYIKKCIDMLEPYVVSFQNRGTGTADIHRLNATDMQTWKYEYYPYFSKSGLIPDGAFFGDIAAQPNYGIGADGAFAGEELCHFLYKLYKLAHTVINKNIPSWRVLFLLCKHTGFNGTRIDLSAQDIIDMKNAMRRFQNFIFAFSGANVSMEVETRELDYEVPLRKIADDDYMIHIGDISEKNYDDGWKYVYENSMDFAVYYARFGQFPTKWLAMTRFGIIGGKNFSFINLKGLEGISNDKYLEPTDIYPFPEECGVHEACHVFQRVIEELFKAGTLANPDNASKYGYKNETPSAPIGGFHTFYKDIISANVKDPTTGTLIGIKPEMWANTMRKYNDSRTAASAKSALSANEQPVVTNVTTHIREMP
ncbi:hypothetical protein FACS1894137_12450 [Spirochaetia bacterium]|nr:hypothetical protein FACS1894137_12450 [Spirochaetia bacterium]